MIKLLHSLLARRAKKRERRRYQSDGGDEALRFNYPLGPDSVVLDLGGYKGQWSSDLYARYRCKIHVFEPVTGFANAIAERFSHNPDISVHDFGLGASNREIQIAVLAGASSSFEKSDNTQSARIFDVLEWLADERIERVALAKLNIEGGEYELLERLIEAGKLAMFDHLQIQFHDVTEDSEARMNQIHAQLEQTHHPEYQYRFVWESWARKP